VSDKIQKRDNSALKEKAQYALTFGVIATMLVVAQFPMVVIFFFGVFAYFLWKAFSQPAHKGIREVFEFYLAANEILRDDDRRWFGFEVQNAIKDGESILQRMHGAPPLVYFALGALYNKLGDHESAVTHLSYVVENDNSDESTYLHPSRDLRDYVTLLRKIERDPKEAPRTSSAIRTLERLRRNKGGALLEESRAKAPVVRKKELADEAARAANGDTSGDAQSEEGLLTTVTESGRREREREPKAPARSSVTRRFLGRSRGNGDEDFSDRKPITEVLHDIYDKNIQ
jgi:tetratricopeptide (TPR) repeat protein